MTSLAQLIGQADGTTAGKLTWECINPHKAKKKKKYKNSGVVKLLSIKVCNDPFACFVNAYIFPIVVYISFTTCEYTTVYIHVHVLLLVMCIYINIIPLCIS